jgi:transcriptional regulator with XRE-family HTH domain
VNTSLVKRDLLNSLKDKEFREAFKLENVYTGICFQIRALREQREKSQRELGQLANMAQERISILEDPNAETKPTLATLLRLADAMDVGLDVRFVPFSTVLDRSVHTDMKCLEVASFDQELWSMELAIEAELAEQKNIFGAANSRLKQNESLGAEGKNIVSRSDKWKNVSLGSKPVETEFSPFEEAMRA